MTSALYAAISEALDETKKLPESARKTLMLERLEEALQLCREEERGMRVPG